MPEFFRGWRRKVGCVALVMACLVAIAWIRSMAVADHIYVRFDRQHEIRSRQQTFLWVSWRAYIGNVKPTSWVTVDASQPQIENEMLDAELWELPYSALFVPLTLLSAVLLLWRQRKRSQTSPVVQSPKEQPHA